jgi:hypothetical protein
MGMKNKLREVRQKLERFQENQFKSRNWAPTVRVHEPTSVRKNTVPVTSRGSTIDPDDWIDVE